MEVVLQYQLDVMENQRTYRNKGEIKMNWEKSERLRRYVKLYHIAEEIVNSNVKNVELLLGNILVKTHTISSRNK